MNGLSQDLADKQNAKKRKRTSKQKPLKHQEKPKNQDNDTLKELMSRDDDDESDSNRTSCIAIRQKRQQNRESLQGEMRLSEL